MTFRTSFTFIFLALAMCSCNVQPVDDPTPYDGLTKVTLLAYTANDNTKTYIKSTNEAYGEISWHKGDELSLFKTGILDNGGIKFYAESDSCVSNIYSDLNNVSAEDVFFGVYPFNENAFFDGISTIFTSIPTTQTAYVDNIDPKALLTAGISSNITTSQTGLTGNMPFNNLCGGIRFSLSKQGIKKVQFLSNDKNPLAGDISVTLQSGVNPVVSPSTINVSDTVTLISDESMRNGAFYYYICMMPQNLPGGFTLNFYGDDDSQPLCSCCYENDFHIERGMFWTIDQADSPARYGKDLSVNGPANCYIVSEAGSYKFPIKFGNSSEVPYLTVSSTEVLWETTNTSSAPSVGSLVSEISTDGEYIYFSTPVTLIDGNALIAAMDSNDNVIWSWHIWFCSGFNPSATSQCFNGKTVKVMDRNLGAISPSSESQLSNGLLYQWGRKDPFMGSVNRNSSVGLMASTCEQSTVLSNSTTGTVDYTIEHPTQYIITDEMSGDWLYDSRNNALWSEQKTIYDPCPPGWKVPDGRYDGIWSVSDSDKVAIQANRGGYITTSISSTLFFPASGYRASTDGSISGEGVVGYYWTTTTDSQFANVSYISFVYNQANFYTYSTGWKRAQAHSVRCVAE